MIIARCTKALDMMQKKVVVFAKFRLTCHIRDLQNHFTFRCNIKRARELCGTILQQHLDNNTRWCTDCGVVRPTYALLTATILLASKKTYLSCLLVHPFPTCHKYFSPSFAESPYEENIGILNTLVPIICPSSTWRHMRALRRLSIRR